MSWLESEGVIEPFRGELLIDFLDGAAVTLCGDCDHFRYWFDAKRRQIDRLHYSSTTNGGAMRLCSECGVNQRRETWWMRGVPEHERERFYQAQELAAEFVLGEHLDSLGMKFLDERLPARSIVGNHMPCGMMRAMKIPPQKAFEAMLAAKRRMKKIVEGAGVRNYKVAAMLPYFDGEKRVIHYVHGKRYCKALQRTGRDFLIAA